MWRAEDPNGYVPGDYHPVYIGDVYHEHYRIVSKIGFGGFATIWLAHDSRVSRYVALKISMADIAQGKPEKEIEALRDLQSNQPVQPDQPDQSYDGRHLILSVLDAFHVTGSNGTHSCYTMVPAHGDVDGMLENYVLQLPLARALAGGLVRAVAHIHRRGYVHGDLSWRNVLRLYPVKDHFIHHLTIDQFYEQYGQPSTEPVQRWDKKPLLSVEGGGIHVPERLVQILYSKPIRTVKERTLADMRIQVCDFGEAFDRGVQAFRAKDNVGVFADDERAAFLDLIRRMMAYRPEDRLTIEDVLQSAWMQKWALPAFAEAEAVQAKEANEAREAEEREAIKAAST